MNIKILLFGTDGQLGSELRKFLISKKVKYVALGHNDIDITHYKRVGAIIKKYKPEIIINTTAIHASAEGHPEKLFSVNSFALHNLAVMCKELGIKFVTYSTDYVFDGRLGKPYIEADKPNPLQMYGLSKYTGEIIASNYNPDSIIIRTCGVYGGKRGSKAKGNFVINMLKEAKMKKIIEVSSEQIVSPTYAVDLAKATIDLLEKNPKGGIYHLVNSGYCSWAEFTEKIMKYKGIDVVVNPVDRDGNSGGIKRPKFSALDNIKAAKMGINLPSWEDALGRYIDFLSR